MREFTKLPAWGVFEKDKLILAYRGKRDAISHKRWGEPELKIKKVMIVI